MHKSTTKYCSVFGTNIKKFLIFTGFIIKDPSFEMLASCFVKATSSRLQDITKSLKQENLKG
jgi:hypothetical protein